MTRDPAHRDRRAREYAPGMLHTIFTLALLAPPTLLRQTADPDVGEFRARLEAEVERQELVGLQATLSRDGEVIYSDALGFADLDHRVALTPETRMPIASVTKALTGVLYLRLVEAGEIAPGADVRSLVPEFPEKAEGPILLEHLVGQTHGIRHYRDEVYPRFFTSHYDRLEDALGIFADDPLTAAPGAEYTYSSYAYTLLGVALERATETSFEELLAREVLEVAGMRRTCANDVRMPIEGRTSCFSFYDPSWPFEPRDERRVIPPLDYSYNAAGGNLLSTTEDLVRFGNRLLEGRLVGAESLRKIRSSQSLTSGEATGWSHGWFVRGDGLDRELRINGSNPGSWAHLRVYPERGIVLALATNTWGRGARDRPKGLIAIMDDLVAIATRLERGSGESR